jgi:hypothetical protein
MNNAYGYGTGMAFSIVAIIAGAVMYWAITAPTHGFRLSTVGVVLMVAGAAGFLISAVLLATSAGRSRSTFDQQSVNAQGVGTSVHEELRN